MSDASAPGQYGYGGGGGYAIFYNVPKNAQLSITEVQEGGTAYFPVANGAVTVWGLN